MLNKTLYYLLSLTWGLPLTVVGGIVSAILLILGFKPKRFGWCWCFEIGENWGGIELGLAFITNKNAPHRLKAHEFGHGIQNCYFGPLMIPVICIPSVIRYWFRELQYKLGKTNLPDYDAIWFEGQATKLGLKYIDKIEKDIIQ